MATHNRCSHCTEMKPAFMEVKNKLSGSDVAVTAVDCTTDEHACSAENIQGYPTVRLFKPTGDFAGSVFHAPVWK